VDWKLLLLAALLLVAIGIASRAWLRRARLRKQVRARRAPRLRHPVVLAHGVLGFDEIAFAGRRHRYFRNIADQLSPLGARFHHPRVPSVGSISARAGKLVELVRELPGERFNVIAHSMGGLDARFAISRLGLGRRVASLVTIGAPHHGTPLAHLPLSRATAWVLRLEALSDLTPTAMERFNLEVPDVPGIVYCSVVASTDLRHTNPLLWPTHAYLSARYGPNDGLVPVSSQRWGKVLREVQADHWAQVGWSLKFDAAALYEEILRELAALGF
jgi:triacylglycerol lipase